MTKDPKIVVKEIVQLVGKRRAEKLLVQADVSTSMAGKLVRDKYDSEIGVHIAAAIEKARTAALAAAKAS